MYTRVQKQMHKLCIICVQMFGNAKIWPYYMCNIKSWIFRYKVVKIHSHGGIICLPTLRLTEGCHCSLLEAIYTWKNRIEDRPEVIIMFKHWTPDIHTSQIQTHNTKWGRLKCRARMWGRHQCVKFSFGCQIINTTQGRLGTAVSQGFQRVRIASKGHQCALHDKLCNCKQPHKTINLMWKISSQGK